MVVLPTGVVFNAELRECVRCTVTEDCTALKYEVNWPCNFLDKASVVSSLQRFTKNQTTLHAMATSLALEVKEQKNFLGVPMGVGLGSTSLIPLPFEVEADIKGIYPAICPESKMQCMHILVKKRFKVKLKKCSKWNSKKLRTVRNVHLQLMEGRMKIYNINIIIIKFN